MTRKSWLRPRWLQPASKLRYVPIAVAAVLLLLAAPPQAAAGDEAPQWLHALRDVPLPAHDDDADAILLYAERNVTLQSANSLKVTERRAYKILRPGGRDEGYVVVYIGPHKKASGMRGWCIPAGGGKDFQIKDKDAVETAADSSGELFSDVKLRYIQIPAADPGSIIGYEYETEEQPRVFQDVWDFQDHTPARQMRYSLELPAGWSYTASWNNYPQTEPAQEGGNRWQWEISDVKAVKHEEDMPPVRGVAGQMVVYFVPPTGAGSSSFTTWKEMGDWYRELAAQRLTPSPEMKDGAAHQTASASTTLAKIQAIAQFVQQNIRYVAIELGVGGWQPHAAADVFSHRYGDCKDKATLTMALLDEVGVKSHYMIVNSRRGAVTPKTPPNAYAFNHMIVAIELPNGLDDPSLVSALQHPKYGRLLLFDPTDELTPFGQIGSYLQGGYGLLVMPTGGELLELPTLPAKMNSIERTARLKLDGQGTLTGDVNEIRIGDKARRERAQLRDLTKEGDRIKPIENILSASLTTYQITSAFIMNQTKTDQPFGFNYSFQAPNYARNAGGLVLVRPRVLGVKSVAFGTGKEARRYPFELSGVGVETDSFDIAIPAGYAVDDLPPAADVDYAFGSYHAATKVEGNIIHYRRSYEIKQVTIPVENAHEVKKFFQVITGDERNMVVLKPAP